MTHLQQIADHLAEMQRILKSIQEREILIEGIVEKGTEWGYAKNEIHYLVSKQEREVKELVKEYKVHQKEHGLSFRAYEVRNSSPIDFSMKPPVFSHTSHNSKMAKDME
jgi:gas vesicle protein